MQNSSQLAFRCTFKDDVESVLPLFGGASVQLAERVFEDVISSHVDGQILATTTDAILRIKTLQFLRRGKENENYASISERLIKPNYVIHILC